MMKPILDPVLIKYRRMHANEVVLLEKETSSDDSSGEQPRGPYSIAAREVDRRKVGFSESTWSANLELEAFLEKPALMKELIEKKPTVTGAQTFQLHYNLKKSCAASKALTIKLHPATVSVEDRRRKSEVVPADSVLPLVVEGRKEMIAQLDKRFFTKPPSEARLVQI